MSYLPRVDKNRFAHERQADSAQEGWKGDDGEVWCRSSLPHIITDRAGRFKLVYGNSELHQQNRIICKARNPKVRG